MNFTKAKEYLGDREFYQNVVRIALPITAQSLITVGVNMMDTIMLGRLGETALSASSLANQFINIYHICCMGIGMGASVLTSRFWGMQDKYSLKKTVTIMLRFVAVFASIFTIITIISPEWIMRIYSDEAPIITHGITYLKWMIPTYICTGLSLTCTIVLRTVGQVKIPLYCSISAFFVKLGISVLFCN